MKILINDIETVLIREDVEGFIQNGAPSDEYSVEAKYIARALLEINASEFTEENILAIISALWAKSFNLSREELKKRLPALQVVAGSLFNA